MEYFKIVLYVLFTTFIAFKFAKKKRYLLGITTVLMIGIVAPFIL